MIDLKFGFPGIQQLNDFRVNNLFVNSHDPQNGPALQFGYWMAHKAVSVISFPANVAGMGLGLAGMVVPGCFLGLVKVAVFAATLGNYKPTFSTGFIRCSQAAITCFLQIFVNAGELGYDALNALYNGYRVIRWIGEKLHLNFIIEEIFIQTARLIKYIWNNMIVPLWNDVIDPTIKFIDKRVQEGLKNAVECEKNYYTLNLETPSFIRPLDDRTKATRIDRHAEDRSYSNIFSHYAYSLINIPVNLVTAAGMASLTAITACNFGAKVIIYAATNIDIPVPTYAGKTLEKTIACSINVIWDSYVDIADSFVLTYKVSDALGILVAMAKIRDVILFIPEAIIS